jgi:hypothetical protein
MTVRLENGVIVLIDDCTSGDAEGLLQFLLAEPTATIDWRFCDAAHCAVVEVLLAAGRALLGPPRGQFLKIMVAPAINRALGRIRASRTAAEVRNTA